jgi:hypothetical protein
VLFVDKYAEIDVAEDRLFHVDKSVRKIWSHIDETISK